MHFLGSDIRGKPPAELAWAQRAGARIVGSYDAIRWVPDAEVVPPGIDLREYAPVAALGPRAPDRPARAVQPAAQGHRARDRRLRAAARRSSRSSRACTTTRLAAATRRPTSSSTSSTRAGTGCSRSRRWRSASRSSPSCARRRSPAPRRRSDCACRSSPRPPTRSPSGCARSSSRRTERRRIGAESRAYVERVHDADAVADRLLEIYRRL